MGKITLNEEAVSGIPTPVLGKAHFVIDSASGKPYLVRNNGNRILIDMGAQIESQYALLGTEQELHIASGQDVSTVLDTWNTVPLASKLQDEVGITLSANAFTLPAGKYDYSFQIMTFRSGSTHYGYSRLYNVTDSSKIPDSTVFLDASVASRDQFHSVQGRFKLTSQAELRLEYFALASTTSINRIQSTSLSSNPDGSYYLLSHIHLWKVAEV